MNKLISKIVNMSVKEKIVMSLWILVAIFLIAEVAVLVAFQSSLNNKLSGVDYGWFKSIKGKKPLFEAIRHVNPDDLKAGFKFQDNTFYLLLSDKNQNILMAEDGHVSFILGTWTDPIVNNSAKVANDVISSISFIFGTLLLGTVGTTVIVAYHNKHDRFFWQKAKGGAA